jgi:hypothetical protein
MSTRDPQADLDAARPEAQPVLEIDIWNPAPDGGRLCLSNRMLLPEPLPDPLPEMELEL